jgi:hypothetical protein
MMRTLKIGAVLVSLLALQATASAESNHNGDQRWGGSHQQWQAKRELYQKIAKKYHKPKPIPIDPGRGDGKPIEPAPQQPPQGPPGFVWVNGHWERVKAPTGPTVVVRDHRKPSTVIIRDHRTPGGVVVRDHRSPGTVIVRDHRTPKGDWTSRPQDASSSPGGVIVTESQPVQVHVRDHRGR